MFERYRYAQGTAIYESNFENYLAGRAAALAIAHYSSKYKVYDPCLCGYLYVFGA
jgi:hypothetical protein